MDFRSRLAMLGRPEGRGARPPGTTSEGAEESGAVAPCDGGEAETTAASPTRTDVLVSLRDKMAHILGREREQGRSERASRRDQPLKIGAWELRELPFWIEEHTGGPVCIFRETLPLSYRVGRVPVAPGCTADSELLSLLALDPKLATRKPARALYFDLETTGLSGAAVLPFVVGLAFFDGAGQLVIEQIFLRTPADEPAMLVYLAEHICRAEMLVSFNGRSYDWPLLETRFVMARLPRPEPPPHLDLLSVGRRLHKKRIGRCRLKNIESEVLGFDRVDDIEGADVAPRYSHYLRTGDEEAVRAVIDHNRWDVASMAALVGIYGEPFGELCNESAEGTSDESGRAGEQSGLLHDEDLVSMAETLKRAKAFERAAETAERAVRAGVGPSALGARARIAKARGDRAQALRDFEQLAGEVDDPAVRLELAKLYEHYVKDLARAREVTLLGTGEADEALAKREARLDGKIAKRAQPAKRGRVARKRAVAKRTQ